MTDTSTLESVLTKTATVLDGVRPDQGSLPTPCEEYTVDQLVQHMVSWARIFANAAADNASMPPGPDGPSRKERDDLADWLACGAQ